MNLANKTTLLLVAFALVPILFVGGFVYVTEKRHTEENAYRQMEEVIKRPITIIQGGWEDPEIIARFSGAFAFFGNTGETMVFSTNETNAETRVLLLAAPPRFSEELHDENFQNMRESISVSLAPALPSKHLRLTDYRGKEVLAVAESLPENGLVLVTKMDTEEIFAPIAKFLDFFLLFSFAVVLISVFLGLTAAKSLTDPIRLLSSAAVLFASDPKHGITFPPDFSGTSDEIGTLWREFRFMSEKIAGYHRDLEAEVGKRTEELEAFSYSVSHDLRAPLRAMDGFVKVFTEEYGSMLDEEGKRIISVSKRNATQMGRLIDDLIAFSRIGRQEMKRTFIPMRDVAQSALGDLREQALGREALIRIGEMPDAFGSGDMIRLVFTNLLSNAIKFSRNREKPKIEVGGYASKDTLTYYVKDNGVGFDMQYANKLFNVFQRLHTEKEFEGTGIGLANVKRIIERHGGAVRAEGAVGRGATFYFTLPDTKDYQTESTKAYEEQ